MVVRKVAVTSKIGLVNFLGLLNGDIYVCIWPYYKIDCTFSRHVGQFISYSSEIFAKFVQSHCKPPVTDFYIEY
jgi:hypothetical protein